jgi:hypothetical protein
MFKSFQKAFDRSTTKPITGWRTDNNKHDARVVEHEVDHTNTNKEKMSKQKDGTTKKYPTSTKQYFHQKKSPGSGMHSSEDQKKKMFDQPEGVKLYYPATNFSKVTKSLGLRKSINPKTLRKPESDPSMGVYDDSKKKFDYNEDRTENWRVTPPERLKTAQANQPAGVKIEHYPYSEDSKHESDERRLDQMKDQPDGTKRTYKMGRPGYDGKDLGPKYDASEKAWGDLKRYGSKDVQKFNQSEAKSSAGLSKSIFRNIGLIKSHDDDDDKDLADRVIGEDKPDLEKMGQMAAAPAAIRPASAATTTAVANPPRMGTPPSLTAPKPNAGLTKSLTEHTYGSQIKRFSNVGRNCRSCGVLVKSIDGPCPSCEGARKGVRWHEGHLA